VLGLCWYYHHHHLSCHYTLFLHLMIYIDAVIYRDRVKAAVKSTSSGRIPLSSDYVIAAELRSDDEGSGAVIGDDGSAPTLTVADAVINGNSGGSAVIDSLPDESVPEMREGFAAEVAEARIGDDGEQAPIAQQQKEQEGQNPCASS
jgi:hypothetical protein